MWKNSSMLPPIWSDPADLRKDPGCGWELQYGPESICALLLGLVFETSVLCFIAAVGQENFLIP